MLWLLGEFAICTQAGQLDHWRFVSVSSVWHLRSTCDLTLLASKSFPGQAEKHHLGTARLTTLGTRQLVVSSENDVFKFMVARTPGLQPTFNDVWQFWRGMDACSMRQFIASGFQCWACSVGPGDLLLMPPAFVIAEKAMGGPCCGLRAGVLIVPSTPLAMALCGTLDGIAAELAKQKGGKGDSKTLKVLEEASACVKEALSSRKAREGWDTGAAEPDDAEAAAQAAAEAAAAEATAAEAAAAEAAVAAAAEAPAAEAAAAEAAAAEAATAADAAALAATAAVDASARTDAAAT